MNPRFSGGVTGDYELWFSDIAYFIHPLTNPLAMKRDRQKIDQFRFVQIKVANCFSKAEPIHVRSIER